MILYLDEKHTLRVEGDKHIGYVTENKVEILDIIVESETLLAKEPYIEFQLNNGRKFTTDQLKYDGNHLIYEIPNTLLYENGFLKVQVVLKELKEITWKSSIVSLVVDESILGNEHVLDSIDEMNRKLNEKVSDSQIDTFVFENLEELRNAINYVYNDKTQLYELLSITYEGIEIKVENIKLGSDVFTRTENESDYWLSSYTSSEDNPLSFFTEQSAKTMIDITYEEFEELEPQENTFYRVRLDPDVTFFIDSYGPEKYYPHEIIYQPITSLAYYINTVLKQYGFKFTIELKFVDKLPDNPYIMTFETRNNITIYFNLTDGQLYLFEKNNLFTNFLVLSLIAMMISEEVETKEDYDLIITTLSSVTSEVVFKGICKNEDDIYKLYTEVFPKNKEEIKYSFNNEYHIVLDNYLLGYYKNGVWHWLEKTLNFFNTGDHFSYEKTDTTTFSSPFPEPEFPWTITGKFGNIIRKVNANVQTYISKLIINGNEFDGEFYSKLYNYAGYRTFLGALYDIFDTVDSKTIGQLADFVKDSERIEDKYYVIEALIDEKVTQSDIYELQQQVNKKVDKENGKGLSTNDYTNADKTKLAGIAPGATKIDVDKELSTTSANPVQNKAITTFLNSIVDTVVSQLFKVGYIIIFNDSSKQYIDADDNNALTLPQVTFVRYNNEYYIFDYIYGDNVFYKKIDQFGFTYLKIDKSKFDTSYSQKAFEIIEQPLAKPIDREGTTTYIEALEYDNEHFSLPGTKVINTTNKTTLSVDEMKFLYEYHLTENSSKEYHGERVVLVDDGKIYYNVIESTELTTTFTFINFDNNSNMNYITITKKDDNTGIITRLSNDILTKSELEDMKGVKNGIASLDSNGKILLEDLPDVILGQLVYGGTVAYNSNSSSIVATLSTNAKSKLKTMADTITLKSSATATDGYGYKQCEGLYFIASTDFAFGKTYLVGDWLVATASNWNKIQNTDAVVSVNGQTGNVVLTQNDVGLNNVDNTSDADKPVSTAQASAIKSVQDTVDEQLSTIKDDLGNKVDKISGKSLSTEDFTTELKNKVESQSGFVDIKIIIDDINNRFSIDKTWYNVFDITSLVNMRLYDSSNEVILYPISYNASYDKYYSIDDRNHLIIATIEEYPTETTDGYGTISYIDLLDDEGKLYSVEITIDGDNWSMTEENWSKYKKLLIAPGTHCVLYDKKNFGISYYKIQDNGDFTNTEYMAYEKYNNCMHIVYSDDSWDQSSSTQGGTILYQPMGIKDIYCNFGSGEVVEKSDILRWYHEHDLLQYTRLVDIGNGWCINYKYNSTYEDVISDVGANIKVEITSWEGPITLNVTRTPVDYKQINTDIETLKANKLEIKDSVTTTPTKIAEYFSDGTNTYATQYTITMKEADYDYDLDEPNPLTIVFTEEDIAILKAHPQCCRIYNGDLENYIYLGYDGVNHNYYTQSIEENLAHLTIRINLENETFIQSYISLRREMSVATTDYKGLMSADDKRKLNNLSEDNQLLIIDLESIKVTEDIVNSTFKIPKEYYKYFSDDRISQSVKRILLVNNDLEFIARADDTINHSFYAFEVFSDLGNVMYNFFAEYPTETTDGVLTLREVIKLGEPTTVVIDTEPTETNGTLTRKQLEILQASEENKIMFNHEKYYLMKIEDTQGFLTYTHIGIENGIIYIKTFTITVNTKSWVLNSKELS